jgi:hypothetical protein
MAAGSTVRTILLLLRRRGFYIVIEEAGGRAAVLRVMEAVKIMGSGRQ